MLASRSWYLELKRSTLFIQIMVLLSYMGIFHLVEFFPSSKSGSWNMDEVLTAFSLMVLGWWTNRISLSLSLHAASTAAVSHANSLSLCLISPPHPASPLPRLPLPSSGFVCSPSAPRCFPAPLRVPLKLLFRSDSGTAHRRLPPQCNTTHWSICTHCSHIYTQKTPTTHTHIHTITTFLHTLHTHTHTAIFLPHPTITAQTLLPVCGGTIVG